MIAQFDRIVIIITAFASLLTVAVLMGICIGGCLTDTDPERKPIHRPNRRKRGTRPAHDRGAWIRTLDTMSQQRLTHAAHVDGWRTRRRNQERDRLRAMGADIKAMMDNAELRRGPEPSPPTTC
jgi:ribonuclease HI